MAIRECRPTTANGTFGYPPGLMGDAHLEGIPKVRVIDELEWKKRD